MDESPEIDIYSLAFSDQLSNLTGRAVMWLASWKRGRPEIDLTDTMMVAGGKDAPALENYRDRDMSDWAVE